MWLKLIGFLSSLPQLFDFSPYFNKNVNSVNLFWFVIEKTKKRIFAKKLSGRVNQCYLTKFISIVPWKIHLNYNCFFFLYTYLTISDEPEPSRAKLGHFNFRAESEPNQKVPGLKKSKSPGTFFKVRGLPSPFFSPFFLVWLFYLPPKISYL